MTDHVGVIGLGVYLPEKVMTAEEISQATGGVWSPEAVREKLGIRQKYVPGEDDGTQEMGARAAQACIEDAGIDPKSIDVILCFGEEWKEYPLTTSAMYIQDYIGATQAWGIDVQNRCCTTLAALKMAKDLIIADPDINTVLLAGGYRNGELIDYKEKSSSMFYDLGAGGAAMLVQRNAGKNVVLGSHVLSDGSFARHAGVEIGGTVHPISAENAAQAYHSLKIMEETAMKEGLKRVSMDNWLTCIDRALAKSHLTREDIDFLNILHIKRSAHLDMLSRLGLNQEQSFYLEDYGHIGQIDQILVLKIARDRGLIKDGDVICAIAAGIGYAWAAGIFRWGPYHE